MGDVIQDKCGIVVTHSLHDAYAFLKDLEHRGRECSGVAAIADDRIDVVKWSGTPSKVGIDNLSSLLPNYNNYHTFFGHVRYATRGQKNLEEILKDAQPMTIGGKINKESNHRIIRDCDYACIHNGQVSEIYFNDKINFSKLLTNSDTEMLLHYYKEHGEKDLLRNIPGSYTIAIADKKRKDIIVMRDKHGIKPAVLGEKPKGVACITSEDIALRKNGAKFKRDLDPGKIFYLFPDGTYNDQRVVSKDQINEKFCMFEHQYIGHVESIIENQPVITFRQHLGDILAEEFHPKDIDIVTYLPKSPENAAERYAQKTRNTFENLFYKFSDERAFMGSTLEERKSSIEKNLFLHDFKKDNLNGKTVLVIDDSLIRGNNIKYELKLLRDAGVKKVYHLNYTPPIGIIGEDGEPRGCDLGVDMPVDDNFIARGKTTEEISQYLTKECGIDTEVYYISCEGMMKAFKKSGMKNPEKNLCYYCIGGKHPLDE